MGGRIGRWADWQDGSFAEVGRWLDGQVGRWVGRLGDKRHVSRRLLGSQLDQVEQEEAPMHKYVLEIQHVACHPCSSL